jgi:predicted phage baseplate assembly protein
MSATALTRTTQGDPPDVATLVVFEDPLVGRWLASSLIILANSVSASQGEAVPIGAEMRGPEILGSGNPAIPLQRFALKQKPLAYTASRGAKGYAPAIEVRVNDRLFEAAETVYGEGPDSQRFHVAGRRDGTSYVQFAGRLPTGVGNVRALYRTGGGLGGNLGLRRLTQAMAPVSGVKGVTNQVPAEGGSDPETLEEMRSTAPKAIRTLDRAVSLADFEAFAEGFRGVGKASATDLRAGLRRIVCLTIATTTLDSPLPGSPLVQDLQDALQAAAPPGTHLQIEGFVDLPLSITIDLATDAKLPRRDVEAAVRDVLTRGFGKAVRTFGTAVHRSELLAAVQDVPGVVAALLSGFSAPGVAEDERGRMPCPGPQFVGTTFHQARLLSLAAHGVTITEMTP